MQKILYSVLVILKTIPLWKMFCSVLYLVFWNYARTRVLLFIKIVLGKERKNKNGAKYLWDTWGLTTSNLCKKHCSSNESATFVKSYKSNNSWWNTELLVMLAQIDGSFWGSVSPKLGIQMLGISPAKIEHLNGSLVKLARQNKHLTAMSLRSLIHFFRNCQKFAQVGNFGNISDNLWIFCVF